MTENPDWSGFGYIGARQMHLTTTDSEAAPKNVRDREVDFADRAILAHAKEAGWTDEDLFTWADSINGRWYADDMFGLGGPPVERLARAKKERLLELPK